MAVGDSNLFFSRDTKVFLVKGSTIWEIPVLNGYSFSQTTNSSTITLSEMSNAAGGSRRGQRVFNDSVSPSEWSFDTYIRPTLATTVKAVEESLWASFVANSAYTANEWTKGVTRTADALDFDFDDSNVSELGTFDLVFVLGGNQAGAGPQNYTASEVTTIYRVPGCVVNEATINFEVDGIAMISWAGMGNSITELASFNASAAIVTGITSTTNYIRNRLTALTATSSVSGSAKTYNVVLTGGSLTLSNNISFLTPESIGVVNQPIGHVTGTRSVSGSFTCYLDEATNGSIDLLSDLQGALTTVTNGFALDFYIGGKETGVDAPVGPGIQFKMGQCHLEVPTINNDDVIALEVNFTALPSNISGTNEVQKISYVAA
jgi:hypothetical protein